VSRDLPKHPTSRARPVADLPLDALLARAEELARRWAIALILARPLGRIGDVPLEDLACEAPTLCAQMLRALDSDAELDRLTGGGGPGGREQSAPARRLAAMAGARDAGEAVEAVEALRGVLWETLLEELRGAMFDRAPVRQVADLADRLACVCASSLAVAIVTTGVSGPDEAREQETVVAPRRPRDAEGAVPRSMPGRGVVIVDEHPEGPVPQSRVDSSREAGTSAPERPPGRPLSWDESPPVPPRARSGEIEIRDERGEQGPSAWRRSIGRHLERFNQDGLPFVVMLVEVLGIERLRREEPPEVLSRLVDQVHDALAAEMRGGPGSLTNESPGRYWLLAARADRSEAERLVERLARAVRCSTAHRGSSLEVAIGTAVCPEDGREAVALAAHADVGLYAARSAARAPIGSPTGPVDERA
jgi:GGDEF domain-containing protein